MKACSSLTLSRFRSAILLLTLIGLLCDCAGLPTDSEMISQFNQHRAEYEEVVKLTREEVNVERISSKFVRLDNNMAPSLDQRRMSISDSRLRRYRELFRAINDPDGIGISNDGVYFYIFGMGFSGSGVSKGVVWSVNVPGKLIDDLDLIARTHKAPIESWRRLAPNWYLEYDAS